MGPVDEWEGVVCIPCDRLAYVLDEESKKSSSGEDGDNVGVRLKTARRLRDEMGAVGVALSASRFEHRLRVSGEW